VSGDNSQHASLSSLNPDAAEFTPTFKNSPMEVEELEFDFASSSEDIRVLEITKSKIFFLSHEQRGRKPPSIKFLYRSNIHESPQTLKQYTLEDNIAVPGPHSYDEKNEINVYSHENVVVVREPANSRREKKENNNIATTNISLVNLGTKECFHVPLLLKLDDILELKNSVKVEVGDIAIAGNKLAMHVFIRRLDDSEEYHAHDDSYDLDSDEYEENKNLVDSLTCLWRLDTSNPKSETLQFWTFLRFPENKYTEDPKKIRCFSLNLNEKFFCRTFRTKEELNERDNKSLSFENNDGWENWCVEVFNVDNLEAGVTKLIQVGCGFEEFECLSPTIATKLEPGKSNRLAIASHNNGLLPDVPDENFAVIFNVESGERIFDMDFYHGGKRPLKKGVNDQIEFVNFCLGQLVFIRQKNKKRKRKKVQSFQYILVSKETVMNGKHVLGNNVEIDWEVDGFNVVQTVRELHVDMNGLVVITGEINLDDEFGFLNTIENDHDYGDYGFKDDYDDEYGFNLDFAYGYVPYWRRTSESDKELSQHSYVYNCSYVTK